MDEISVVPVKIVLEVARKAGLDLEALTAGLSFNARTFRRRRSGRVSWSDYCTLVERIEAEAGGPQKAEALFARLYHSSAPPEFRRIFGALVSAKMLYRFLFKSLNPATFPNQEFVYQELSGERLRIRGWLRPGERPCRSFFRLTLGIFSHVPQHLGLPPATVEVEELTDRSLAVVIHLAPSQTLVARAHRASVPALRDATLRLIDLYAGDARAGSDRLSALLDQQQASRSPHARGSASARSARLADHRPSAPEPPLLDRLAAFESAHGLTAKQVEVVALVVRGLTNKEIASELDCAENTVEFHVTQLLRKTAAENRAQLIARFWAASA